MLINIAEDNAPFTGELLLYTEPSGVGQLSASLVSIEDGFGVETYRSCNRREDPTSPRGHVVQTRAPDITEFSYL